MLIWETGETGDLAEITRPDVVYDDVPNGETFTGREGVAGYVQHVHSWASNVEIEVVRVSSGSDTATAEWIMHGVQDRPIPGRVPVATGRSFDLRGVTLIEVRGGKISRAADYIDVLKARHLLGSGGVCIRFLALGGARSDMPTLVRTRRLSWSSCVLEQAGERVPWVATVGGVAVALVMGGAWLTRFLDQRYVDVAWITFYGLSCLWIAHEWREFRFWKRGR